LHAGRSAHRVERHSRQQRNREALLDVRISTADPKTLGDYGLGVLLGAGEAERAATLLGHKFQLVGDGPATAQIAPHAPPGGASPIVAMRGERSGRCTYLTDWPDGRAAAEQHARSLQRASFSIVDWHPRFRRYGAGELNERFEKRFGKAMSSEAWHGWVAVKAVFEAAIRGADICAELARLRFDGHKGRALSFDRETRRLRHPALIVSNDHGKEIVEVVP
jgi:hypothetical protein